MLVANQSKENKPTILVVNDNFPLLNMLIGTLEENFSVYSANNGLEALDFVIANPRSFFDVILLDINMPIMDGFEAFEKITKHLQSPGIIQKPVANPPNWNHNNQ